MRVLLGITVVLATAVGAFAYVQRTQPAWY